MQKERRRRKKRGRERKRRERKEIQWEKCVPFSTLHSVFLINFEKGRPKKKENRYTLLKKQQQQQRYENTKRQ